MKKLYIFAAAAIMFFSAGRLSATDYTWTGATDNDWGKAANWNPSTGVPGVNDRAFFSSGTWTVTINANSSIGGIILSSGATVTFSGSGTVILTLKNANSSATDLNIPSNASLTLEDLQLKLLEDGITCSIDGTLTVSSGATFNLNETTSSTTTVSGALYNINSILCSTSGRLIFSDGSYYYHGRSGGTIPAATWGTGSNCYITGIISSTPSIAASQTFGNFIWDCTQTTSLTLSSNLTSVSGTFYLKNTGGSYSITQGATSATYGNFSQSGGLYYITNTTGSNTLNVQGNFSITSGTFYVVNTGTAGTLNIDGSLTVGGGILNLSNSSAVGNLSIAGDLSHTSGTITETSSGSGTITFDGSSSINSSTVTLNGTLNVYVNSGATLQMGTGASPATLSGSDATFTLSSGGTLGITSPNGITSSGASGNIQVGGTRSYSTGANYIYNGSGSQSTGGGLPTSAITGNITISDGATVSPWSDITANGTLTVNGILNPASDRKISGAGTLTGSGTVNVSRTTSGSASFLGQYDISNKTLSGLTVSYTASGGSQTVNALDYGNLTLSNTSGTNTLAGNATVNGTLTTTAGGTFNIGTNTLTVNNLNHNGSLRINSTSLTNNGSFIATGTITQGGSSSVTYIRQLNTDDTYGDRHFFSPPVTDLTVSAFTSANSSRIEQVSSVYQIWEFDESFDTPENMWPLVTSGSFVSGKGYNLDQTNASDGAFNFTGKLVSSNVVVTATSPYATAGSVYNLAEYNDRWTNYPSRTIWGGGGWNLIGNPFTSALDVTKFIFGNNTSFDPNYQTVYVYNGTTNTYDFDNTIVQAGQGFFVMAEHDGVTCTFSRSMQTHDISQPMYKSGNSSEVWPGIKLKVRYGENESKTSVIYDEKMTAGLDPGYDIGLLSTRPAVEVYTKLVNDNGINFARQALPPADFDRNIIAVGIDAENSSEITFSADIEPIPGYNFYLEDRLTGTITDLSANTYKTSIPSKTYGTGRFYIIVSNQMPTGIKLPADDPGKNTAIWYSNGQVIVKGILNARAVCTLYDTRGQKILETRLDGEEICTVPLPSIPEGAYIVRVRDGVKTTTQKIIILR